MLENGRFLTGGISSVTERLDIRRRRGVTLLRIHCKGEKLHYLSLHPATAETSNGYLEFAAHVDDFHDALFWPLSNNMRAGTSAIKADGVY